MKRVTEDGGLKITIKLFATLRKGRFEAAKRGFKKGSTVDSVRRSLGISKKDAAIVLINGIHAEGGRKLQEGDVLAIFPPSGGG